MLKILMILKRCHFVENSLVNDFRKTIIATSQVKQ